MADDRQQASAQQLAIAVSVAVNVVGGRVDEQALLELGPCLLVELAIAALTLQIAL
jgi:hypothetical protein